VFSASAASLVALALAVAVGPEASQVNVNVGPRAPVRPVPPIGSIGGYRPPVRPVPPIGSIGGSHRPRPPGSRPFPPPVRPVPPIGSLRPSIYSPAYFRQFPPGFRTILVGNVPFYYFPALPPGATFVPVRGVSHFVVGGMWLLPHETRGRRIFLVVPPPFF